MTTNPPEDEAREWADSRLVAKLFFPKIDNSGAFIVDPVIIRPIVREAHLAGQSVGYQRALEDVEKAFKAGQNSIGWRDDEMSRIDETWEGYKAKNGL